MLDEVFTMNAEEVVRTYSDMVYKIAFNYVRSPEDADDVYSETFLAYFKKEREFESEEHRKAWLIKVTINEAKTLLSKRSYGEEINDEILGGEDKSLDTIQSLDLKEAILRLPEHQREVIMLFYMQGLSTEQISGILGKNKNTVAVTLMRAKEALRKYLESE